MGDPGGVIYDYNQNAPYTFMKVSKNNFKGTLLRKNERQPMEWKRIFQMTHLKELGTYLRIIIYEKFLQCKTTTKNNLILIDKGLGLFYKDIQVANKHVV